MWRTLSEPDLRPLHDNKAAQRRIRAWMPERRLGLAPWPQGPGKSHWLIPPDVICMPHGLRVSYLVDDENRRYLISSKINRGSFGKLKFIFPIDDAERSFCVKETRRAPSRAKLGKDPARDSSGRIRTFVVDDLAAQKEAAASALFGGPFAVFKTLNLGPRRYHFSELASSTVYDVALMLQNTARAVLSRYVADQIATALAVMHKNAYVHLDVSINNILVGTHAPFVALSDFGAVERGYTFPAIFGLTSTYTAPEALLGAPNVSGFTDVWSLGASLLTTLYPFEQNHFLNCRLNNAGEIDCVATYHALNQFFQASHGDVHDGNRPIARWLKRCAMVDSALTHMLLDDVLVPQHQRISAKVLMMRLRDLPPLPDVLNVNEAMAKMMAHLPDTYRDRSKYRAMQWLRNWVQQQMGLRLRPDPPPGLHLAAQVST